MVDDSIVRGTTARQLVGMLRDAGAKEVHVRVASPAILHPCYMGIDMASPEELIASRKPIPDICEEIGDGSLPEELVASRKPIPDICEEIGADSLAFLSIEGLMKALNAEDGYCNACFTGEYPFEPKRFEQMQLVLKDPVASVWGA